MKVLMQGRFNLLSTYGGDRIQIENTAKELKKLGVDVDIIDDYAKDFSSYDLVHIFQLDWTPETHFFIKQAKEAGKPVVFSPIHHDVEEVKRFDNECVYDYRRISKFLFKKQHSRDTFKNVYRSFLNPKKIKPTLYSSIKGLKNIHRETLSLADKVLVQTRLEARDLSNTYGVNIDWYIVPNGVGKQFLNMTGYKNPFHFENYIFSVGRIEPRKNQLKIIEAVNNIRQESEKDLKLVFIGLKNTTNHCEYTFRFNRELKKHKWITYINKIPYEKIPAYFHFSKVTVSASWFETTGLTLLDSLFCGANAVASSPRAREMLGDLATYCDPGDVNSIKTAIETEFEKPRPVVSDYLRAKYTWKNAAKKTLEIYKTLCL